MGYVGYAYYKQNESELRALKIISEAGPILPNMNTIADGSYPLSRSLFIYVNTDIVKQRADVREFIEYYIEHATEFVNRVGYFPLSNQQYKEAIDDFERATNQAPLD
ncbi:MAG: substrate-binding domain-containing protein [Cyanobacteria bacterium P01_A01_bin.123]